MRLLGYTRTKLVEDLGEHDLEEQERALAEFCSQHKHELVGVVADEGERPQEALQRALNSGSDGLVVTDSLVIADTLEDAGNFIADMVAHNKHLFVVLNDMHIDPRSAHPEHALINQSKNLLNHNIG